MNREQNITHLVHIVKAAAEVHGNLGVGDSTALRIAEAVYSELERFPQFIPQEPLTLKTEDGRFVKVEPYERDKDGHWEHNGDIRTWVLDPPTRFRIVEDQ